MGERPEARFEVLVEEGYPHGDLYELEQTTFYQIVDKHSHEVVMAFRGKMEASLDATTGMWGNYYFSGVREVAIAPDERSATVRYYDDHEEVVPLPC